jgi:hypothetical protein
MVFGKELCEQPGILFPLNTVTGFLIIEYYANMKYEPKRMRYIGTPEKQSKNDLRF